MSKAAIPAHSLADITSADTMYSAARRVTCRVEPKLTAARVTRLMLRDTGQMSEARGRWTQVTLPTATACLIATRFVTDEKPEPEPPVQFAAIGATATPTVRLAIGLRRSQALLEAPRSRAQARVLGDVEMRADG